MQTSIETGPSDTPQVADRARALAGMGFAGAADADGWHYRNSKPIGLFDDHFIDVRYRTEDHQVRLRINPTRAMANMNGVVHGAFVMGLVDYALFLVPVVLGVDRVLGGATIDAATQFYAPVVLDTPVDLVTQVMRTTGRMVFVRGVIEQGGVAIGGFSGTVRRRNADDAARSLDHFARMRGV